MGKFFLFKRPLGWRVLPSGRSSPASLVAGALHFGEIEEKQSEQREFGFFFSPNWLFQSIREQNRMGREASCRAGEVGNGKGWKTKREAERVRDLLPSVSVIQCI